MNADKLIIYLFIIPIFCFSQTKNDDAYYILDVDNPKYVITSSGGKEVKNIIAKEKARGFKFYKRDAYEGRKQQIKKDKKEGNFYGYQYYQILEDLVFREVNSKVASINHCDTHFLNLVDYDWLVQNSWKENNPNILFKNLYFLLKINKDKYLKIRVERTLIA
ncbi:hypothetical protein V2611_12955, partial [Tenacibaculum maritimum]